MFFGKIFNRDDDDYVDDRHYTQHTKQMQRIALECDYDWSCYLGIWRNLIVFEKQKGRMSSVEDMLIVNRRSKYQWWQNSLSKTEKTTMNQSNIINISTSYIHRSNWSPIIIKNVILKPYLNQWKYSRTFPEKNIDLYIYRIIQTEQILCQTLPHFIKTNVSYDEVDGSQQTIRIA